MTAATSAGTGRLRCATSSVGHRSWYACWLPSQRCVTAPVGSSTEGAVERLDGGRRLAGFQERRGMHQAQRHALRPALVRGGGESSGSGAVAQGEMRLEGDQRGERALGIGGQRQGRLLQGGGGVFLGQCLIGARQGGRPGRCGIAIRVRRLAGRGRRRRRPTPGRPRPYGAAPRPAPGGRTCPRGQRATMLNSRSSARSSCPSAVSAWASTC